MINLRHSEVNRGNLFPRRVSAVFPSRVNIGNQGLEKQTGTVSDLCLVPFSYSTDVAEECRLTLKTV